MSNSAVFGIYSNRAQANAAIEQMKSEGFRKADISMLFPRSEGTQDFAFERDSRGLEGSSAGAAVGAVMGGALGWLMGIGAVAIPAFQPYVGHGPFLSLLSGAILSATLGGLAGGLTGMGISAYKTVGYKGQLASGSILLLVHGIDLEWTRKAWSVLERTGGEDIAWASEREGYYAGTRQASSRPDGLSARVKG